MRLNQHTILLLLLSLYSGNLFAANTGAVKGQVVDREGEVLPFATVVLMHAADSSMAKAGYTDEMGQFGFEEVEEGAYLLNVRYTSMAPAFAAAFEVKANAAFTVPNIVMAPTAATLEGLTITAQKSLISIKPDMMVFNVSASTTAIGTNALELLRKAPGVSVDQRDRIMLQGKAGVRIYIDGKPTPLTDAELAAMLRAMPAQQIDNIELITNPSARFEAEGNAGIINIVLQKSARKGGHATVALGYNVQENARYEGALSGNYRSEKVNIYGAFNQNNGTQANFMELHRRQNGHVYDQRVDVLETTSTSNGRLGMDVDLSEKSTFGVMANGFLKNVQQDQHALTEIREMGSTQLAGLLDAWSQNEIQHFNGNVNANYRFEDKEKGSEWNVDANYGFFDLNTETYQPNVMYDFRSENPLSQQIFTTFAPTQIDIAAIKVDHTRNFLGGQLGFGGKISRVRTTNDFQLYDRIENEDQLNTELSNRFDYSENVNALYTTWQGESGKWNFQAGLRAEQTNSLGQLTSTQASGHDTVARSYVDLFPSAGLTYQLDGRQTLRLNYSRRIDRPRYQNLNPFLNRLDALTFKQGNPFLQPQYTHSLEVAHVLLGSVSTSLRYSRTTDLMTELADTIAGGGYLTHVNLDQQDVIGIFVSAPLNIARWWNTFTDAGICRTRNQADFGMEGKTIDMAQTTWQVYHQSTFNLPADFAIELSGFYNAPALWGANFQTKGFGGMDIGASKRFLDGRGSVKMAVTDVFHTMQWAGSQSYGGLEFEGRGGWESRQFKVNVTYRFGSEQFKRGGKRKTGLDDVQGRA